jgi:hypothetical protein
MRYMMLIAGNEADRELGGDEDERRAAYGRIRAWWDEQSAAGRIVEGHELEPTATATTVRIGPDGDSAVTDGPFVESKEVVGGYAILDVADLDEAIKLAASWPAGRTALEIRPIIER